MTKTNGDWWWRTHDTKLKAHIAELYGNPDEFTPLVLHARSHASLAHREFRMLEEWPAFLYELARRTPRAKMGSRENFPPWPKLSQRRLRAIMTQFPPRPDATPCGNLMLIPHPLLKHRNVAARRLT